MPKSTHAGTPRWLPRHRVLRKRQCKTIRGPQPQQGMRRQRNEALTAVEGGAKHGADARQTCCSHFGPWHVKSGVRCLCTCFLVFCKGVNLIICHQATRSPIPATFFIPIPPFACTCRRASERREGALHFPTCTRGFVPRLGTGPAIKSLFTNPPSLQLFHFCT